MQKYDIDQWQFLSNKCLSCFLQCVMCIVFEVKLINIIICVFKIIAQRVDVIRNYKECYIIGIRSRIKQTCRIHHEQIFDVVDSK